jgi:hypothetical protein
MIKGVIIPNMAVRALKSFFPTADELLAADISHLGEIVLVHLNSYEGRVKQNGRLYQGYLLAMLENRNVGLGRLPPAPEYGPRQPEVTRRVMEAWYWLERQGFLVPDPSCRGWHLISTEGERRLAKLALFERCEKLGLDRVKTALLSTTGIRDLGDASEVPDVAREWVRTKEGQDSVPPVNLDSPPKVTIEAVPPLPNWNDLQADFLQYALEHGDLCAVWSWASRDSDLDQSAGRDPIRQWLFRGGLPASQHLYKEIASRAAGRLGHSDNLEPWLQLLNLMRAEGYARKEPSRRASWHRAKTRLESGEYVPVPAGSKNEVIEHVFKASADFCFVRSLAESKPAVTGAGVQNQQSEPIGKRLPVEALPVQPAGVQTAEAAVAGRKAQVNEDRLSGPSPMLSPAVESTSAETAKKARAATVAKLIKELDRLKPQMLGDEPEYGRLREQYPQFLTFKIAEDRRDLKLKILSIRGSTRHIRLAQELAAAHHGRELSTIQDDWKDHKPAEFKRQR